MLIRHLALAGLAFAGWTALLAIVALMAYIGPAGAVSADTALDVGRTSDRMNSPTASGVVAAACMLAAWIGFWLLGRKRRVGGGDVR